MPSDLSSAIAVVAFGRTMSAAAITPTVRPSAATRMSVFAVLGQFPGAVSIATSFGVS